jgi:hypothetical protein
MGQHTMLAMLYERYTASEGRGVALPFDLEVVAQDVEAVRLLIESARFVAYRVKIDLTGQHDPRVQQSIEDGVIAARMVLQNHGIIPDKTAYLGWATFETSRMIRDESAGLLGALAFMATCISERLGRRVPFAWAATGKVERNTGKIDGVDGLNEKIAAALVSLKGTGGKIFYPGCQQDEIRPELTAQARAGRVTLHPVNSVSDAFMEFRPTVQVRIHTPTSNMTVTQGTSIHLQGAAVTTWGEEIDDSALVWTSDKTGPLGTGKTMHCAGLSRGTHQISLLGTAPGGLSAKDTMTIHFKKAKKKLHETQFLRRLAVVMTTVAVLWTVFAIYLTSLHVETFPVPTAVIRRPGKYTLTMWKSLLCRLRALFPRRVLHGDVLLCSGAIP